MIIEALTDVTENDMQFEMTSVRRLLRAPFQPGSAKELKKSFQNRND